MFAEHSRSALLIMYYVYLLVSDERTTYIRLYFGFKKKESIIIMREKISPPRIKRGNLFITKHIITKAML